MSAPTYAFSKLGLEGRTDMASRRSLAQQERRRRENEQRMRETELLRNQQQQAIQPSSAINAASTSQAPTTVIESSGIRYNISNLSSSAYQRALWALRAQMYTVDFAMSHQDNHGPYVAFQLKKTESWLYDGINHTLYESAQASIQSLDMTSIERRLTDLSPAMADRLPGLPNSLNSRGDEATEGESSDDSEDITVIQDMLSVLDDKLLPDEFNEAFMARLPKFEKSYQSLLVPNDLTATMFGLARHNTVLRDQLRMAIPKEVCAQNFLQKLEARSQKFFQMFDDYASKGPTVKPEVVSRCAESLRDVIEIISHYQESRGPTSKEFDAHAANLAVRILDSVTLRDRDIYISSPWLNGNSPPTEPRNRNLFTNLVRDPPIDEDDGTVEEDFFVLDLLIGLRMGARYPLIDPLQRLLKRMETGNNPPRGFIEKLYELTTDFEEYGYMDTAGGARRTSPPAARLGAEGSSDPSRRASSINRRPTVEGQPEPQRRRLD